MTKREEKRKSYMARLDEVKKFIETYWTANHYAPGNNEVASRFRVSNSVASYWLDDLEELGYLEPREPHKAHNIVPVAIFRDRLVFPLTFYTNVETPDAVTEQEVMEESE
jgi:hypothetical protein